MESMNIKLISPHMHDETDITSGDLFNIQKVALPLLAALTPPEHQVKIVDETFVPDEIDGEYDLVGISVTTQLAARSYRLAQEYRQRGAKVVLGGVHPSVLPNEAIMHADAVVIGEAEGAWPQLVKDAQNGILQKIYRSIRPTELSTLPVPRRDLYPRPAGKQYAPLSVGVETSRGCPYDCEFCSVNHVMGSSYRHRSVSQIIAEIEAIDSTNLFFVDDAIALDTMLSKKFFSEMIPLRRKWVGQGTASLAQDISLLKTLKRSGCHGLLIGFESVDIFVQKSMNKSARLKVDYSELMKRFHGEGIGIMGSFIFGFDHEEPDIFDRTIEFIESIQLDSALFRPICPYPGTRFYDRLLKENRMIEPKWWLKGLSDRLLLFHPMRIPADELVAGLDRVAKHFFSYRRIVKRFFGMNPWKRTLLGSTMYFGVNYALRKRFFKERALLESTHFAKDKTDDHSISKAMPSSSSRSR